MVAQEKEILHQMSKQYVEKDPETGLYVGIVPNLHGAHTQAATLDELQKNLREVIDLCLEHV